MYKFVVAVRSNTYTYVRVLNLFHLKLIIQDVPEIETRGNGDGFLRKRKLKIENNFFFFSYRFYLRVNHFTISGKKYTNKHAISTIRFDIFSYNEVLVWNFNYHSHSFQKYPCRRASYRSSENAAAIVLFFYLNVSGPANLAAA